METNLPLSHGRDKNRQKGIFPPALKSGVQNSSSLTQPGRNPLIFLGGVYLYYAILYYTTLQKSIALQRGSTSRIVEIGVFWKDVGKNPGPREQNPALASGWA